MTDGTADAEEMVMLSGRVPESLKRLVDADERNNQEVLRAALWREFGGERKAALERRLEEQRDRVSLIERQRNERQRELEDEQDELERIKTLLEERKPQELIEIDDLIDDMVDHGAVMPRDAERVQRIAREHYDGNVDDCVAAITERRQDRDIDTEVVR